MINQELVYFLKYIEPSKVKHAFFKLTDIRGFCGMGVMHYKDKTHVWHSDVEGLQKRRLCGGCINVLDRMGNTRVTRGESAGTP